MARAEGKSPAQAWTATQPNAKQPDRSARRLEESPAIKTAIARAEEVALRGSLMTAAQRRDYVLDRLITESVNGGDSARVRSLELLGKTAGLFIDRAEVSVTDGADVLKQKIETMLRSIRERGEEKVVHDASIDDNPQSNQEDDVERVNGDRELVEDGGDPHGGPTHPAQDEP